MKINVINKKMSPAQEIETESLHGTSLSGCDTIMQVLLDEGIDTIFGYSGGAILPTFDAIFRLNKSKGYEAINLVVPANEQGAGFMASGYARASGKPGVVLVTSGPGATNCVTPVRDCLADSIPVVFLCGQVPNASIGTDAFQEAPIFNIMASCAKHVFLVKDRSKLEATLRTAFALARSGRPGPVVVDLPKDVQNEEYLYTGEGMLDLGGYWDRLSTKGDKMPSAKKCTEFFDLLKQAKRPLLYVGGGIIHDGASEVLSQFIDQYQIPVVTTLMGIGAVNTKHPLCLHMLGMHGMAYANYAVEDCDFLLAIGTRFDDRVAGQPSTFAPRAKVIAHIDIDCAEIDKVKKTKWNHHGSAKETLSTLISHGRGVEVDWSDWHKRLRGMKEKYRLNYDRKSALVQPYYVLEELNKLTEGRAIFSTGVGQHQMWAAQYLDYESPRTWLTSGSMGTMGFGLPAAIGAQFACPDKQVFDIDGDGSLRMNFGELETVTNYNLPVKILLLNNYGDGMVRQWQKLFFKERFSGTDKTLHQKDFVKAAEADGFHFAKRIERKDQVIHVLKEFVAEKGPSFLEVIIDKDAGVYPMVSPGTSYKKMITGDFIPCRKQSDEEQIDNPIESENMF